MCGIAGILGREDADERKRRVLAMTHALTHRGPDDEGFFDDESVTLGFRRLAVIDLETGQQPIVDPERQLAIVLNGEIYNFRELREELQQRGHRFRPRQFGRANCPTGTHRQMAPFPSCVLSPTMP